MKNSINISDNINSIINTYKCLFFHTAAENLRCCSTASTIQRESVRKRENEKVLESTVWNAV